MIVFYLQVITLTNIRGLRNFFNLNIYIEVSLNVYYILIDKYNFSCIKPNSDKLNAKQNLLRYTTKIIPCRDHHLPRHQRRSLHLESNMQENTLRNHRVSLYYQISFPEADRPKNAPRMAAH